MFDIEKWLPFLMAKSHQVTFNLMKTAVENFDLTPPQFATLAFLWKRDGMNLHELGSLLCFDRTTIGGIVGRLEKLGYVRKEDDPEDRRSSIVFVTEKGENIKPQVLDALQKVQFKISQLLTEEEQEHLLRFLTKLRRNQLTDHLES